MEDLVQALRLQAIQQQAMQDLALSRRHGTEQVVRPAAREPKS
jgi:hypothetical protein